MRWVSRDGRWRVDRIHMELTGCGRDGEWLRVTDYGYQKGEARKGEARDWDGKSDTSRMFEPCAERNNAA